MDNSESSILNNSNSNDQNQASISHSPLDLGSSRPVQITKVQEQQQKTVQPQAQAAPVQMQINGRISHVKTFFTKLHPGAMNFLDEQICDWLKNNPDIVIKNVNVITGNVQAKKLDPNIIITIWY